MKRLAVSSPRPITKLISMVSGVAGFKGRAAVGRPGPVSQAHPALG